MLLFALVASGTDTIENEKNDKNDGDSENNKESPALLDGTLQPTPFFGVKLNDKVLRLHR